MHRSASPPYLVTQCAVSKFNYYSGFYQQLEFAAGGILVILMRFLALLGERQTVAYTTSLPCSVK